MLTERVFKQGKTDRSGNIFHQVEIPSMLVERVVVVGGSGDREEEGSKGGREKGRILQLAVTHQDAYQDRRNPEVSSQSGKRWRWAGRA